MANYYTKFSFMLPLPTLEAQAHIIEVDQEMREIANEEKDQEASTLPPELKVLYEEWSFELKPSGRAEQPEVWLHSEYGGVEAAIALVQYALKKYNPDGRIEIEWATDCDKPRLDAFTGGAAIITANTSKEMSTSGWLAQHSKWPESNKE